MHLPTIILSAQDCERITRLLDVLPRAQRAASVALEDELARAHIVDTAEVPGDIVTMNSRVVFEDLETGKRSEAQLVYPHDVAKFQGDAVSILAPVGSALLGLRVGQAISWPMPSGKLKRYRVLEVVRQPAARGDATQPASPVDDDGASAGFTK